MAAFRFFQLSIGTALFCLAVPLEAQFPEDWMGVWKGMMHIYKSGKLVDSVAVTHIIRPDQNPNAYVWRREYHSTTAPVVKGYKLIAKDRMNGAVARFGQGASGAGPAEHRAGWVLVAGISPRTRRG